MTPERLQQVEELFHAALAEEPEGRAGFLARACGDDEALRREVESLLDCHERGVSFIEQPAGDVAADLLAARQPRLKAGQLIGRYRVERALGAGGMGEVYLAEDVRLGRPIALKLLTAQPTAGADNVRRFERGGRARLALNHPNIVTIHEVGQAGPLHFIAAEFVDGETLRERMAGGRMSLSDALDVAAQVASALQAAHEAGIVHRDLKPENIMLRHRDRLVKLLDFGLAKLVPRRAAVRAGGEEMAATLKTSPGVIMGTAAYMAPEQARGLEVDPRTDIWSLGCVLYEMVAGHAPFNGPTPSDVMAAVLQRDPEPLAERAPEIPAGLERVVARSLAKDRERRYQTAEELLADIESLRSELEVGDERPTRTARGKMITAAKRARQLPPTHPSGPARRRALYLAALAGVLLIAMLVATLLFRQGSTTPPTPAEIKSLAVLPLENLSGDASQEYFADGMTEALITDLAKIGALRVISRSSVMRYKGGGKTLPEVGRELGVDAVLTGSVARSGGRVRIAVQLTHAATERNLWADSYERDLRDVLVLQRDVTRDIVGEIRVKLTPQEQVRFGGVRHVNPEAYDHYLRGQFYLHRQNREGNEAAVAFLERAVAADPNFAAAHAELAQAYVWKLFLFAPNEERLAERAYVAAEKALSLDPDLAVAYLARGRLLWTPANRFPHEKAIREYQRALTLNPNLDEARNQLALVYNHIGAFDAALDELKRAVEINPGNNLAQFRIGETLLFKGEYEEALASLRGVPADVNPALVGHQIAWALFNLGRREESAATIEQFMKDYPEDNRGLFTGVQAVLAASAGQERLAEEKIRSAIERGKGFGHFHHTAYYIACAYALMGQTEQAVNWLEAAAEDGFPCYPLFERDANLDNLRRDARFTAFMMRLRRRSEYYRAEAGF
jgi:eukaryotic-like serine/threonine-protein kinase